MRITLASLVLLFVALAASTAIAQGAGVLYDNGFACPGYCHDAWQVNGGYVVSDSFFLITNSRVNGFDFWAWEFPGDKVLRVQWSITSEEFGGTTYGSGTTLVAADQFQGQNEYGYDIDKITVTGLNVVLPSGTYWLNLQNVVDVQRYPVYWDENSGEYCRSRGCPSLASDNQIGTIPSETFDIRGAHLPGDDQSTSPEPSSSLLWGPGLLELAGALRRLVL